MRIARERRFGVSACALLICSALGACAPGLEDAGTDPDTDSAGGTSGSVAGGADAPLLGGATPTAELSTDSPSIRPDEEGSPSTMPDGDVDETPVSQVVVAPVTPPVTAPPTVVMPVTDPTIEVDIDPTPDSTPAVEPVAVTEFDVDPLPEADPPVDALPGIEPEEEAPTNPFDVADEPPPGTDPAEKSDAGATNGEEENSTPDDTGSDEGAEELPTHDPNGIPYCD